MAQQTQLTVYALPGQVQSFSAKTAAPVAVATLFRRGRYIFKSKRMFGRGRYAPNLKDM